MKNFFDYHYYRVAKFYFKRDGTDATTALISVSAVQGWIIINVLLFIKGIFIHDTKYKYEWIIFLIITIGFFIYNKGKYKNKYFELRNKWGNEEKSKKTLNGLVIIITIIISWCLILINAAIFKKFG